MVPEVDQMAPDFLPDATTVGALVRELASRLPHRPAIITDDETLSFAEFDQQTAVLASALLCSGLRRGHALAVWMPNQIEWLLCLGAAARLGVMLVPINTWFKDDEVRYVLRHSGARALVAADQVRRQDLHEAVGRICPEIVADARGPQNLSNPALPDLRLVVQLGPRRHRGALTWEDLLARGNARDGLVEALAQVAPDDPMYLLYTSGSTAAPKGVPLLQGHCVANGHALGTRQGLTPSDRSWLVQPLFWALGAMNMLFSVWTHGAAVVLQRLFDAGEGLRMIERHRATHTFAVGNISTALLAHPDVADADLSSLVRGVSLFSEADRRRAYDGLGMRHVVSVYGSTETHGSCFCAWWNDPLEKRLADNGSLMSGWEAQLVRPGTDVLLSDPDAVGELTVRGRTTPGYWNAPAQTAEAFDSDGWFHTGDLVRLTRKHRLIFVSRLTEMIKTGGINVAPAEVESVLARHPDVRQAYVFGAPHPSKGEIVVGVIEGVPTDPEAVRAWMTERVAGYKVPAVILQRADEAIPRLATGKVDKRTLRSALAPAVTDALVGAGAS